MSEIAIVNTINHFHKLSCRHYAMGHITRVNTVFNLLGVKIIYTKLTILVI